MSIKRYRTFHDVPNNIAHFIDEVYHQKRLHSDFSYVPPNEFEEWFLRQHS